MKALVLEGKQQLELKNVEIPSINKNQVLIQVSYCGVCGSDLDRYFYGKTHFFPFILGHEFSGVITETGEDVTKYSKGDRVTVAPLVPCGDCYNCLRGEPQHCNNYGFIGSRQNGAMAEYVAVNEENIVPIPEKVSLKEAALIEPLTVAIHGIERIPFNAGSEVAIFGAGTIGIMTLLAAKARGAGNITVIDINSEKLDIAKKLGANYVLNSTETDLNKYYTTHTKPEVIFETAGAVQSQVQSIEIAEHVAKVVYIGTASRDVLLPAKVFEQILRKELKITGSWMNYSAPYPGYEWRAGLQYMENGVIDVLPLVSEVFRLEDKEQPFNQMNDPNNSSIKLLYELN